MTKYILHGGETSRSSKDNDDFFFEMIKDASDSVLVLLVYFSRPKEQWKSRMSQDVDRFVSVSPDRDIHFVLADEDMDVFKTQIEKADVIYMRGGNTQMLLDTLRNCEDFGNLINGKVVSGSSAGACALSKYFHTGKSESVARDGLGILPLKVFVHYLEDKQEELSELEKYGEELKVYKIPEEKFFVIEC